MKPELKRRDFLKKTFQAGIISCALLNSHKLNGMNKLFAPAIDKPDPKKLNYCGYICPEDCKFLRATVENNIEKKKEAYKIWKIKEKFGIEFDPDKIFCWGCKIKDKPLGIAVDHCTVRNCAISKNHECCIECNELPDCKKELWDNFPDFKKTVIEMQKKYLSADEVNK
jgi:hypothetical protein